MRALLLAIALLGAISALVGQPAAAFADGINPSPDNSAWLVEGTESASSSDSGEGSAAATGVSAEADPVCLDPSCNTQLACEQMPEPTGPGIVGSGVAGVGCIFAPNDPRRPQLTTSDIQRAFRRVPVPASVLRVEPPDHRTLVNFKTNFYTVQPPFTRQVRLLGHRVDFRITASEFIWHYGDGVSRRTTQPGAAYPRLLHTYQYQRPGRVTPRVDTVYTANFRVDGGAWAAVPGTVSIAGPTTPVTVLEAIPMLTSPRGP